MAKAKILGPFTNIYPFYEDDFGDSSHDFYVLEQQQKNGDILCGALYKDGTIVECKYDKVGPCFDSTFFAKEKGIWKLVGISGKVLREFGNFEAKPVFSKLIVHNTTGRGLMDKEGKLIIPCQYTSIIPLQRTSAHIFAARDSEDETWLFDEDGKQLTSRSYERIGSSDMSVGAAPYVAVNDMIDLEWSDTCTGSKGSVMFNCKLKREVSACEDGVEVSTRSIFFKSDTFRMHRDGLVQLCEISGRILIPFEEGYSYFGDVPFLSNDEYLFPARKDRENEYVFLNRYGALKFRNRFAEAGPFRNGMAIVAYSSEHGLNRGVIDRHGNLIVKPLFSHIKTCFRAANRLIIHGLLNGDEHNDWACYNENGEAYELVSEDGTNWPNESCTIHIDGQKLYFHQKTKEHDNAPDNGPIETRLVEAGYQAVCGNFHNRKLYVKETDGKYGLYDRNRKELVPPIFDNIEWWSESLIVGAIRASRDYNSYLIFL